MLFNTFIEVYDKISKSGGIWMNGIMFDQSGHTVANLYVLVYSVLSIVGPIAIAIIFVWYLIMQIRYREQLLNKLDSLIQLIQQKDTRDE